MADFAHLSATMERERAKKAKRGKNRDKKDAKKKKNMKPEDDYALIEAARLHELAKLARNPQQAPKLITRRRKVDPQVKKRTSVGDGIMQTEKRLCLLEKTVPTDKWGMSLADDPGDGRGLVVTAVTGGLAKGRLEPGDRIVQINGFKVTGKTVRQAAPAIKGQYSLALVVYGVPGFAGRHTGVTRGRDVIKGGGSDVIPQVKLDRRKQSFDAPDSDDEDLPAAVQPKKAAQKKQISAAVAAALAAAAELNEEEVYGSLGPRTVAVGGGIAAKLAGLAAEEAQEAVRSSVNIDVGSGKIAEAQAALKLAEAEKERARVAKLDMANFKLEGTGMAAKMAALQLKEKEAAADMEQQQEYKSKALKDWSNHGMVDGGSRNDNQPEIVTSNMEQEEEFELGSLKDRMAALKAKEEAEQEAREEMDFGFQSQGGGGLKARLAAFGVEAGDDEEPEEIDLDWMADAFGGDGRDNSAMAAAFGMSEGAIAPKKAAQKKEMSSRVADMLARSQAATAEANAVVERDDLESPFKRELQGSIAAQMASLQQREEEANTIVEVERHAPAVVVGSIAEKLAAMTELQEEQNEKQPELQSAPKRKSLAGGLADRLNALGVVEPEPETPQEAKVRLKKEKDEEKAKEKAAKETEKQKAKDEKQKAKDEKEAAKLAAKEAKEEAKRAKKNGTSPPPPTSDDTQSKRGSVYEGFGSASEDEVEGDGAPPAPEEPEIYKESDAEPEAPVVAMSLKERMAALKAKEETEVEKEEVDFGFESQGVLKNRLSAYAAETAEGGEDVQEEMDGDDLMAAMAKMFAGQL